VDEPRWGRAARTLRYTPRAGGEAKSGQSAGVARWPSSRPRAIGTLGQAKGRAGVVEVWGTLGVASRGGRATLRRRGLLRGGGGRYE
jgi:hypothetical protein